MLDDEEHVHRELPIDWIVPESIPTLRATHIVIQQSGPTEFIVSFFEQRPPLFMGSVKQQLDQFKKLEKVPTVCVARLVVNQDKLLEFVDVFKDSIDEFHLKTQAITEKKEN